MNSGYTKATVEEVKSEGKSIFDDIKADLSIKTGKTGGKHFLVKVDSGAAKPTLIAIHL